MRIIRKRGINWFGNKKGQLTIFIIVALVIVALILIYFAISRTDIAKFPIFGGQEVDLKKQFAKCVEENKDLDQNINLILSQGGNLNPINYLVYNGIPVDYLCYTNENYKSCVMQKPLLLQSVENEIKKVAVTEISGCMNSVKRDLESQGYTVSLGRMELNASALPKNIVYTLNYPVTIQKEGNQKKYDNFEIKKASDIYQMIMISNSILNYETRYGEADILAYMIYYPEIRVNREKRDDGSTVYIISGRKTKETFIFAVRSFAWPAGYGGK